MTAFLNELQKSGHPKVKEFLEGFLNQKPQNLVVFRVVYLPPTAVLPSRCRIYSERFKQYITITNDDAKFDKCRDIQERAIVELKERGFNIVSIGEGVGCMYVMSDTFKPFK